MSSYTLINWIKTRNWEGALIEDSRGKRYLTSGVCMWPETEGRKYEVVDSIDTKAFYARWRRCLPNSELVESIKQSA